MNQFQISAAFASLAAVLAVQPAHASELYARASVGQTTNASISGVNFNDGMSYGAGVGGAVGPVRLELGADRVSGDIANVIEGHAMVYSATGFIDVPVGAVTVSGGAGVDYVRGSVHAPYGGSYDAEGYGWHWAVQGSTRVSDRIIAQVEYRHLSADLGDPGTLDADQISAGFRFRI